VTVSSIGIRVRLMTAVQSERSSSPSGFSARAQLQQQCAHLGQGTAGQLARLLDTALGLLWGLPPGVGQCLGDQAGREQGLGDGVVQLARQALALLDRRQVTRLIVESGVLDRSRRLIRERQCELRIVVGVK
jgi:hypothetical protein